MRLRQSPSSRDPGEGGGAYLIGSAMAAAEGGEGGAMGACASTGRRILGKTKRGRWKRADMRCVQMCGGGPIKNMTGCS